MGSSGTKKKKDYEEQIDIGGHHDVSIKEMEYFQRQMKYSICKINTIKQDSESFGTGFFCIIPFPTKLYPLPVLITNNHVLNENDIKTGNIIEFSLKNDELKSQIDIDELRKTYTSTTYDTTIIEIKEDDNLNTNIYNFLEIDDGLYEGNLTKKYFKKPVYLLHYKNSKEAKHSLGDIKIEEDNFNIVHYCNTDKGSSGGPILNLSNFKVLGVHKGSKKGKYNLGTLINIPINDFYQNQKKIGNIKISLFKETNESKKTGYLENKNIETSIFKETNESKKQKNLEENNNNEITIIYQNRSIVNLNEELKKEIKNSLGEEISKNKLFGEIFVKNNRNNCRIIINGVEKELFSFYNIENLEENQKLEVKLKGINNVKDMSYMFCGCLSLFSISEIWKWETNNVTNLTGLFYGCSSLTTLPDISEWNTNNVISMGYLFDGCSTLKSLPDISKWNTNNVTVMGAIFRRCSSLTILPDISKWNTNNVINLGCLFDKCSSLKTLPNISNWNTNNVTNMNSLFCGCSSLIELPDISNWNTNNVNDIGCLFYGCTSLKTLPDISKWDTSNINDMGGLFYGCSSLQKLPDISKWNTINVNDISHIFDGCSSLTILPDISKWNTKNVINMRGLFFGCSSLTTLPDISKWDTKKVNNMRGMFFECSSLTTLPDISKWNTNNVKVINNLFDNCNPKLNIPQKFIKKFNY